MFDPTFENLLIFLFLICFVFFCAGRKGRLTIDRHIIGVLVQYRFACGYWAPHMHIAEYIYE